MSDKLYTIVELNAKQGKLEELKNILSELASETRKEPGALEYFFVLDQQKPNTILSYEKWTNSDEEGAHWQTPHLMTAVEKLGSVLEGDPIVHKGHRII